MRHLTCCILTMLALTQLTNGAEADESQLEVTYIANCGFIVECGDKKVIIDGLFGGFEAEWCFTPADSVVNLMSTASSPFDNVSLILTTHGHIDHFDADITAAHMNVNSDAVLICPHQAAEKMQSTEFYDSLQSRIRVVDFVLDSAVVVDIAGINVSALCGHHSPWYEDDPDGNRVDRHRNVQHLEFVVNVCGRVLYHSGDAALNDTRRYEALGFGKSDIDVAFVGWWDEHDQLTFTQKLVHDLFRPKRIFLMHMMPDRMPKGNPELQSGLAEQIILPKALMQRFTFD